jgi:FG-GAP repeat
MSRQLYASLLMSAAALGSACKPSDFDAYADGAPIRVITRPDDFRTKGLGNVLVTARTELDGKAVSRIYTSAGQDSPVLITRAWNGKSLGEESFVRCRKRTECSKGTNLGASLIPFDVWAPGSPQEKEACLFVPAMGHAYVFCESGTPVDYPLSGDDYQPLADLEEVAIEYAGAGLATDSPLGFALLGTYVRSLDDGTPSLGRLFFQPHFAPETAKGGDVPQLEQVRLVDPGTGALFSEAEDAGDFGRVVRAVPKGEGLFVAISQPSKSRVVIAEFDPTMAGDDLTLKWKTRACIKAPDPDLVGFGKRVVFGDFDADSQTDVVIGIDPSNSDDARANGGAQRVWLYRGTGLPSYDEAALACPLWDAEPVQVGCLDGVRGVGCDDTGFGASLAVGDVDADGIDDLLVGAPYADVQGSKDNGAVWIIPGSDAGLDFAAMTNVFSTDADEAHLGMQVGALRTDGRDEPVGSAPGEERTYMFMCTKLDGDANASRLCLPK